MSFIYFGATMSLANAATPSTGAYIIAYDSDGILKQKDEFGSISFIGSSGLGSTPSLSEVLAIGNTAGSYSIEMTDGSSIYTNSGSLLLDSGSTVIENTSLTGNVNLALRPNNISRFISEQSVTGSYSLVDLYPGNGTTILPYVKFLSGSSTKYTVINQEPLSYSLSLVDSTLLYGNVKIIEAGSSYNSGSQNKAYIHINSKSSKTNSDVEGSVIIGGEYLTASNNNTVYLGNSVNINNKYTLPNVDGSSSQVLQTDGSGTVTWVDVTSSASNGLQISNNEVILGGTLSQNVVIDGDGFDFTIGNGNNIYLTSSIVDIKGELGSTKTELNINYGSGVMTSYWEGNTYSQVAVGSQVTLETFDGLNTNNFIITQNPNVVGDGSADNLFIIKDEKSSKGLVYLDDYSSNFTTYSLVTKGYVDSVSNGTSGTSGTSGFDGTSGTSGLQGAPGQTLTPLGVELDYSSMTQSYGTSYSITPPNQFDTYIVQDTAHLWIYSPTSSASNSEGWVDMGVIQGPQGLQGTNGTSGTSGFNGTSGTSGTSGFDGTSGTSGIGSSGTSGISGNDGSNSARWVFNSFPSPPGDPGSTYFSVDNSDLYTISTLSISSISSDNNSYSGWLKEITNYSSNILFKISEVGNNSITGIYLVDPSNVTYYLTYTDISLGSKIYGTGSITNGREYSISWVVNGENGTSGIDGTSGTSGFNGTHGTSGLSISSNLGRILYVSSGGNDLTAEVGNITKPFSTIIGAKDTSVSGDLIYVLPQTMTYSNTSVLSYPYNGSVNSLVNLWKDGVDYYFSPGSKIIFYNETPSGSDMYLFRPTGGTAATCRVFGHLEFEQNGIGADSSNGFNCYFYGTPIGTDEGYTFYSETKSLKSNHCQLIDIRRTSSTGTARVTIINEEEDWSYIAGQSAAGAFYYINNNATSVLELTINSKIRRYNAYYPWYFYNNANTSDRINILGNDIYNTGNNLFLLRITSNTINCHLDKIYYKTALTSLGYFGSIVSTNTSGGWKLNLKADLIDSSANSLTTGLFYLTTSGNTLNFDGNIITNTISGVGRFIAATRTTNTININGDISISGTSSTTNVLFQTQGGSTINYRGKISGNYAGPVVKTYTGTVSIINSMITSTVDGGSSQVFTNGSTTLGTCRINNSYIELKNSSVGISDGSYVKALINNSTIVNSGTSSIGMSNTTNFGTLQLSNSVVISGATSISYTGTASVIGVNSTVNATYSISDLKGSLPILTDLIY